MALSLTPATVRGLMPPGWPFPHSLSGWMKCLRLQLFLPTCCCLHRCPRAGIPDAARGRCGHVAVRWRPPPAEPSLPAAPSGALTPQRRLGSLRARTFQLCPPTQVGTLMRFVTLLVSVCESRKWLRAAAHCSVATPQLHGGWFDFSGSLGCGTRTLTRVHSVVLLEKATSSLLLPSFLPLFSLSCNPFPPFLLSFPSGKLGT